MSLKGYKIKSQRNIPIKFSFVKKNLNNIWNIILIFQQEVRGLTIGTQQDMITEIPASTNDPPKTTISRKIADRYKNYKIMLNVPPSEGIDLDWI